MLDNLKVGKKLFLLSTSILVLMLAVMFSGYHGITRSVESSKEVSEIQETAKLLATLEIDHLNWADNVTEYLSNDRINSLDVQTDHTHPVPLRQMVLRRGTQTPGKDIARG
ncbi:MAG: hypothetical protein ACP5FP_08535 [Desulfuromonadaceae bacterium]